MPTLLELEPQVLALTESERLQLVSTLLTSLPPETADDEVYDVSDEEVLRRLTEAENDPSVILAEEQFWTGVSEWRSQTP